MENSTRLKPVVSGVVQGGLVRLKLKTTRLKPVVSGVVQGGVGVRLKLTTPQG